MHTTDQELERSPAVGDFYGTRIEIWAGFGPVQQLLRPVFTCFHEQKKILKILQTVAFFKEYLEKLSLSKM